MHSKKKILIDTSNPKKNIKPEKKTILDETNGPYIEHWVDEWPERKLSDPDSIIEKINCSIRAQGNCARLATFKCF